MKNIFLLIFVCSTIFCHGQQRFEKQREIANYCINNNSIDSSNYLIFNLHHNYLIIGVKGGKYKKILLNVDLDTIKKIKESYIINKNDIKNIKSMIYNDKIYKKVINKENFQTYAFFSIFSNNIEYDFMIPLTAYNNMDIYKVSYPIKFKYVELLFKLFYED